MKKIIGAGGIAALVLGFALSLAPDRAAAAAGDEAGVDYISMAMQAPLPICPTTTLGQAANAFFQSPRWEQSRDADGRLIVHVIGMFARNNNKIVISRISFVFDPERKSLQFKAMDTTGIPQTFEIYAILMRTVCT